MTRVALTARRTLLLAAQMRGDDTQDEPLGDRPHQREQRQQDADEHVRGRSSALQLRRATAARTAATREHEQRVRQDADLIEQLHRVNAEEQRAEERHQRRERTPAGEIEQHGGCQTQRLLRRDEGAADGRRLSPSQECRQEERIEHRPERIVLKRIAVQDVLRRVEEDLGVGPENAGRAEMNEDAGAAADDNEDGNRHRQAARASRPHFGRHSPRPFAAVAGVRLRNSRNQQPEAAAKQQSERPPERSAAARNPRSFFVSASSDPCSAAPSGSPIQTPLHRQPVRSAVLQVPASRSDERLA